MKTDSHYIQPVACGLFDSQHRLEPIQSLGDPLAALNAVMDWTIFDPVLARIPRAEPRHRAAARPIAPRCSSRFLCSNRSMG